MTALNKTLDRFQGEAAARRDKRTRETEQGDIRFLMGHRQFRRFVDRLLTRAHCFNSIMAPGEQIYFNSGQQDFGFFVMAELEAAAPDGLFLLMKERVSDKQRAALELIEEAHGLQQLAKESGDDDE